MSSYMIIEPVHLLPEVFACNEMYFWKL